MEVGRHIRELRGRFGLSQDDLAARVYVSRQTISNWENARTYPDLQSLVLLARIFGVTVDRETERGRRERLIPTWMRAVRTAGLILLGLAVGAFVGYAGSALLDLLAG